LYGPSNDSKLRNSPGEARLRFSLSGVEDMGGKSSDFRLNAR
jgi:hypothetical protein